MLIEIRLCIAILCIGLTVGCKPRSPNEHLSGDEHEYAEMQGNDKECIDRALAKIKATRQHFNHGRRGYNPDDKTMHVWVGPHHWRFTGPLLNWIDTNKPYPGSRAFAEVSLIDWNRPVSADDKIKYPAENGNVLYGQLRINCFRPNTANSSSSPEEKLTAVQRLIRSSQLPVTQKAIPELGLTEWRDPSPYGRAVYVSNDPAMKEPDGRPAEIGCSNAYGTVTPLGKEILNSDRCNYAYLFAPDVSVSIDFPLAYLPEWRKAIQQTKKNLQTHYIKD